MRIFLTVILPLLAPSLLYILWLLLQARGGQAAGQGNGPGLTQRLGESVPWVTLVGTGAVLAVAVTMGFYMFQPKGSPDSEYIPPRYEDGKIIPGEMRPRGDGGATGGTRGE